MSSFSCGGLYKTAGNILLELYVSHTEGIAIAKTYIVGVRILSIQK
jgi:hypothetical protein